MEDVEPSDGEDLVQKFDRILDAERPDLILVYWPARSKMQTTFDEMLLLRKRIEARPVPRVVVLHQAGVARITPREFQILEKGGRSRYLEAVRRVPMTPIAWDQPSHLERIVAALAAWEF
jgi:hypothetical protein